jgi:hypothetical protein
MVRMRVTHLATGRSMIASPDELLEFLPRWWADEASHDGAVDSLITQAVYEWEQGVFDGWRNECLGVTAEPV